MEPRQFGIMFSHVTTKVATNAPDVAKLRTRIEERTKQDECTPAESAVIVRENTEGFDGSFSSGPRLRGRAAAGLVTPMSATESSRFPSTIKKIMWDTVFGLES